MNNVVQVVRVVFNNTPVVVNNNPSCSKICGICEICVSFFLQNVLSIRIKSVPLHQQNPPRFPKTSEPGRGVFLYRAMRYSKQPISINDQIAILKGRGLIFTDEQKAQIVLENISYFRLAGYWRTMEQNSSTHLFRTGSRFEDVVARYNFDSELKTLIFAAIQQIEISVRTRIIHFFSLAHGAFWFLDNTLAEDEDLFNENLSYLRTSRKTLECSFLNGSKDE